MAIKLNVKYVKPYREVSPIINGEKSTVLFGIKVYNADEIEDVHKEYSELFIQPELQKALAQLRKLDEVGDKTSDDYYDEHARLQDTIAACSAASKHPQLDFYKSQILFIKRASLEIEDEKGKSKDLVIADTRTAEPVDSLWSSSDECLVVLLDVYMQNLTIRESLTKLITDTIFNLNISNEAKGKN